MSRPIFVNLPTRDISRSRAFFSGLGWDINPQFSDDNAICVVISETMYLMILTKGFLQTSTGKPVAYPETPLHADNTFSEESREAVDEVVQRALASGGTEPRPPQDMGSMYYRAVLDPDGNQFSFVYLHSADAA